MSNRFQRVEVSGNFIIVIIGYPAVVAHVVYVGCDNYLKNNESLMALEGKQFDVDTCSTLIVVWLEIVFDCDMHCCELRYVRLTIIFIQPH